MPTPDNEEPATAVATHGNFYEAFRPYSAVERAQLRWRMSQVPQVFEQKELDQ